MSPTPILSVIHTITIGTMLNVTVPVVITDTGLKKRYVKVLALLYLRMMFLKRKANK